MDFVERYRAIVDLPRPVLQEVRVAEFLGEIDQLIGPGLRKRGINFDVGVARDGVGHFDRSLVEQGVINLVKNAADAVDDSPAPKISLVGLCDAGAVTIQVTDNGLGIEGDLLEEIFVPFFTTKAGGAGIGLALAQQIALAHGGRLSASQVQPAGSMFELRLPAKL